MNELEYSADLPRAGESVSAKTSSTPPADPSLNFARRASDRVGAQAIALAGLGGFGLAWLLARFIYLTEGAELILLFVSFTALPMVILSVAVNQTHRRVSAGLNGRVSPICWTRVGTKFLGLMATLASLTFIYWLFPEYAKSFYAPVWQAALVYGFPILLGVGFYFVWADRRMASPQDGYWHAGISVLGRFRQADRTVLKSHALGWMVKGFFLPLMLAGAVEPLGKLVSRGLDFSAFPSLFSTFVTLVFALDVTFGAIGYLLTCRVLDAQIRSSEPTLFGWLVTILCYIPISTFIWTAFLSYRAENEWYQFLAPYPLIYISWGFAIMVLYAIYVWATLSFGCRFSNLTNRGIIVDGPYSFIKHPAYVAKNLAWWMIYIPFAVHGTWSESLRACICLLATNLIYALRAYTEERHLMKDPAYIAYSEWIRENGLVAQLRALVKR